MNIKENSKILKLSYVLKNYEDEIKEAKQTKKDYEIFLDELLEKEIAQRKENGIKKRLRYAKFPIKNIQKILIGDYIIQILLKNLKNQKVQNLQIKKKI